MAIFENFAEKKEFLLEIKDELLNQLENDLNSFTKIDDLINDSPYITFKLNDVSSIYFYDLKFQTLNFSDLNVVIQPLGLDFLISYDDKILLFPIFEIEKHKSISFKNLFNKKKDLILNNKNKVETIKFNTTLDFFVDTERFENCNFCLRLEQKLSNELCKFYQSYLNHWDKMALNKYRNLAIYFNKDFVEDNVIFEITNCNIEKFVLNFIQNRLFFITQIDNQPILMLNNVYFTTLNNKALSFVNFSNNNASFNKDDNSIKFNSIIILKSENEKK